MTQRHERIDTPFVVFENVRKTYDGTSFVVRDLSFEIPRGEFMSFLGPSGSGKTTTLMMLAGFEHPSGGNIALAGCSMTGIPPYRRNIGVVFQNYALFPHMTAEENIAFPLVQRRLRGADLKDRVRKALDMVDMLSFGARYPAQLSGDQQQRIALARAFVFDPSLVLMDEPLGALDRRFREQMQAEIKRIHRRTSTTIVYVTHDQAEALAMSDRVAVFNRGHIEQIGSPNEIYESPSTEFVAGFVGENNLVRGRVTTMEAGRIEVDVPGLGIIRVRSSGKIALGSLISLAIRPEKLHIGMQRSDGIEMRSGRLTDVTYRGDHLLCTVEVGQAHQLRVQIPTGAVTSRGDLTEQISIGWRLDDWVALSIV